LLLVVELVAELAEDLVVALAVIGVANLAKVRAAVVQQNQRYQFRLAQLTQSQLEQEELHHLFLAVMEATQF
jgi:hypothetical protein